MPIKKNPPLMKELNAERVQKGKFPTFQKHIASSGESREQPTAEVYIPMGRRVSPSPKG